MSNELFIYKLKHQVVHHQCIAEPVFFLCFRKPDPDLKDGVWGLLFLLIEFLVFLGLAVVWEYWTEPDRICTVIFIYFFLVVTWYKSGLHLPALWNYLGLKSLTEAMPLGPSPRPGTCLSHILTQWKKPRSLNVVFVDIASSWWYKPGVMLFLWNCSTLAWFQSQITERGSQTKCCSGIIFLTANICIGCKIESITIN